MSDNKTLALRIADLERQLSSYKELYESAMLSEATAKQYAEEVDKQNAALQAQVEALRSAVIAVRDVPKRSGFQVNDPNPKAERLAWMRLNEVLAATPQHHLAELRAEAGRAGFIAGVNVMRGNRLAWLKVDEFANQYANQLRKGE